MGRYLCRFSGDALQLGPCEEMKVIDTSEDYPESKISGEALVKEDFDESYS